MALGSFCIPHSIASEVKLRGYNILLTITSGGVLGEFHHILTVILYLRTDCHMKQFQCSLVLFSISANFSKDTLRLSLNASLSSEMVGMLGASVGMVMRHCRGSKRIDIPSDHLQPFKKGSKQRQSIAL